MNKANFNSLKNIKAPQDWIDKAAVIPETCAQKKRAVPIYRVAAAASLVLVSVIGLLVFLFFGDKAPIGLREDVSHDAAPTDSASADPIPNDGSVPRLDTVFPTLPRVVPTDADGNPVREDTAGSGSVKEKKNSSATEPTERVKPTQKSAKTTESKRDPTQGTAKPTEISPSQTETPAPTDSPAPPADPPVPTEIHLSVEGNVTFFATFDASLINDGETVYCMFSAEDYPSAAYASAEKQRADYYITKNGVGCAYYEALIDLPEYSVTYRYVFVSESGKVLASGTQVV